ncbi:MAG: hypothetical protein IID35_06500 [Planctomycetes bacterium]|nr:hypothetical protein [Planctomycetota bacterium]
MEEVNITLLLLRWVHILAAMGAIGGALFMRFALLPAADSALDDEAHTKLREALRGRWARVVHTCIALLLITGGVNFALFALPPNVEAIPYHPIFGVKVLAAFAVFFVVSILMGRGTGFPSIRGNRARALSIVIGLGVLIVLLSGLLNQIRTGPAGTPPANDETSAPS